MSEPDGGWQAVVASVDVLARRQRRVSLRRDLRIRLTRVHVGDAILVAAVVATIAVTLAMRQWPWLIPPITFAPIVLFAGLNLRMSRFVGVCLVILACLGLVIIEGRGFARNGQYATVAVLSVLVIMGVMWFITKSRARLGTYGVHGDNLLVDLRDRLAEGGRIPHLPDGWRGVGLIRSANGDGFSGDFLLTSLSGDGSMLEVALIDVSGKGQQAASRSLLLSGAFGGLLGSVPPEQFLPAANGYLLRQHWVEGFATAVHIEVDLETGEYSVGCAGHPAPGRHVASRSAWGLVSGASGPLLGILDTAQFSRASGRLADGDALLLYTDGIIESRDHDLSEGVERMLAAAGAAMAEDPPGVARAVTRAARSGQSDDRAVFALIRS